MEVVDTTYNRGEVREAVAVETSMTEARHAHGSSTQGTGITHRQRVPETYTEMVRADLGVGSSGNQAGARSTSRRRTRHITDRGDKHQAAKEEGTVEDG